MTKTVPKMKSDRILIRSICQYILILMLIGFLIFKATTIQNLPNQTFCLISEATDSTLLKRFLIRSLKFWVKANSIEKLTVKEVKNHTDLFLTVKWDSLKSGTMNNLPKTNKKSRIFWKLSIGKLLEVHLSNTIRDVPIMMI